MVLSEGRVLRDRRAGSCLCASVSLWSNTLGRMRRRVWQGRGARSGLGALPGGPSVDGDQQGSAGPLVGEGVAWTHSPHSGQRPGWECCWELGGTEPLAALLTRGGWAEVTSQSPAPSFPGGEQAGPGLLVPLQP